jgi:tRNA threonylcarbamoyladenosine biosynthesis protein TsaB
MITLALETSTPRGGVALFNGTEPLFSETFTADRSHSSQLFTVIQRALAAGPTPAGIAVGLGPGSYAGVRIAIAAAIGLSVANGAALIGLPSIAALADGEYLAAGDAHRGGYSLAQIRDGIIIDGPTILTPEELNARLAEATLPIFSSEALPFPNIELRFPQVDLLARLAIAGRAITARGSLEPLYLRDPHITTPKAG